MSEITDLLRAKAEEWRTEKWVDDKLAELGDFILFPQRECADELLSLIPAIEERIAATEEATRKVIFDHLTDRNLSIKEFAVWLDSLPTGSLTRLLAAEREKVLEEAARSFEDEYVKQESMAMGLIRGLKAIRALGGPRHETHH